MRMEPAHLVESVVPGITEQQPIELNHFLGFQGKMDGCADTLGR